MDSVPSQSEEKEDATTDGANGKPGQGTPEQSKGGAELEQSVDPNRSDEVSGVGNVSPSQSINAYPQALPAHLTPQQPGYYV